MRLKFLFFPITLIVSAAIIIGYIWPQINVIMKISKDKLAKNVELQMVKEKQLAIEMIGNELSNNIDREIMIKDYLPENKSEERIINGINYLSGDANVSLVDISISSAKSAPVVKPVQSIDPMTGLPDEDMADISIPMQTMPVNVSITGDYNKIRIFLDDIQRMPLLNTIKSLNITKQTAENYENVDVAEVAESNNPILNAELALDFGYLNVSKVNDQQVRSFVASLDNETIDSLKKYISQKSQLVVGSDDVKKKTNPFIAE